MKKIYLVLLFWIVCAVGFYVWTRPSIHGLEMENDYKMLPRSYEPRQFDAGGNKTLSYWVQLPYPAGEAVRFYEQTLERRGWKSLKDWKGMGEQEKWTSWSAPGARTQDGVSCAYQYHKAWVSEKKGKMILMILNYYDPMMGGGCNVSPRSGELLVTLQEMPKP